MSTATVNRLCKSVDTLGALNAQIAALTRQANVLKDELKASGYDEVLGYTFRAVITTKTTARLDTKLVRALLSPVEIEECTVESNSTSVSLFDL